MSITGDGPMDPSLVEAEPAAGIPEPPIGMLVGLGNPGQEYTNTRHNIGFSVLDRVSERFRIPLDHNDFGARFGIGDIHGRRTFLIKPMMYMNRCGLPVASLCSQYGLTCQEMLIVHDDIDLAFGRLKIKRKGGDGGHRGLRSLIDMCGHGDFVRLRIGIGRSEGGADVIEHVLSEFSDGEKRVLGAILTRALAAVITILRHGVKEGMNRVNRRNPTQFI